MERNKSILTYGFAIFAMFFGSGNLVFPLEIGLHSGSYWIWGFLGLLITGIILPFLGLFVIKTYKGNYLDFFGEAGYYAKILVPFFTLSLLGSFGVVPRCITVAYGGIKFLTPDVSLWSFALIFSIISFFICLRERVMIQALGKILSPLLLIILVLLIAIGVFYAPKVTEHIGDKDNAFMHAFTTGYQIMDLFAAFFFSSLIFQQIKDYKFSSQKDMVRFAIKSSFVGSFLLMLIYLCFIFLAAKYSDILQNVNPEMMLPTIASNTIGNYATILLAYIMLLSCLTTAVALNNIYANYLCKLFKLDQKIFPFILAITVAISFFISLFNFKSIAGFLAPILEVTYPSLILLTIMCIITKKHQNIKKYVFWGTIIISIVFQYLNYI